MGYATNRSFAAILIFLVRCFLCQRFAVRDGSTELPSLAGLPGKNASFEISRSNQFARSPAQLAWQEAKFRSVPWYRTAQKLSLPVGQANRGGVMFFNVL